MGLALDPGFAGNRRFYSCQGVADGGGAVDRGDRLDGRRRTGARPPASPTRCIGGIPVNERSGRHGGCRLRFDPTGALLIGTGDNAVGTNPQDPGSLGRQGAARRPADDPRRRPGPRTSVHARAPQRAGAGRAARHRAGVLRRARARPRRRGEPAGGGRQLRLGPRRRRRRLRRERADDRPGHRRAPSRRCGPPGDPTLAASGATFLDGDAVGRLRRTAACVGVLKGQGVLALRLDDAGALASSSGCPSSRAPTAGSAPRCRAPTAPCTSPPTTAAARQAPEDAPSSAG